MLKIGLTGGIGCGKSTVCKLFQNLGIAVLDADIIGKQLVMPGTPGLSSLVQRFGMGILDADGNLDRVFLRGLVFADPQKREQLEQIMHPLIYAEIANQIEVLQGTYCIIAIPLLLETQKTGIIDRVAVVDCSVETQISRVISRDDMDSRQVSSIIACQIPRAQRLVLADDVIDNSGSVTQLAEQIKRLHNSYNLLATVRNSSA